MIKVRRVSAFFLRLLQKYHTFSQKVLDKSLTGVYTVYVDSERGKKMHEFLLGVCWGVVITLALLYVVNFLL